MRLCCCFLLGMMDCSLLLLLFALKNGRRIKETERTIQEEMGKCMREKL